MRDFPTVIYGKQVLCHQELQARVSAAPTTEDERRTLCHPIALLTTIASHESMPRASFSMMKLLISLKAATPGNPRSTSAATELNTLLRVAAIRTSRSLRSSSAPVISGSSMHRPNVLHVVGVGHAPTALHGIIFAVSKATESSSFTSCSESHSSLRRLPDSPLPTVASRPSGARTPSRHVRHHPQQSTRHAR